VGWGWKDSVLKTEFEMDGLWERVEDGLVERERSWEGGLKSTTEKARPASA
jgi:hypothetical protein